MILQTNISGILSLFFSLSFADILHNFSNTCIIIHHSNICWKLTYSKDIFSKFQLSLIFFFTFYNKFSKFHSFKKKNQNRKKLLFFQNFKSSKTRKLSLWSIYIHEGLKWTFFPILRLCPLHNVMCFQKLILQRLKVIIGIVNVWTFMVCWSLTGRWIRWQSWNIISWCARTGMDERILFF